ncbi:C2H2 zinc finger transcription factor [Fusarium acuminatum]|uniref:C2H2 zinc finger transcription factor n=1 Tax=Fusarium acuminatum TaxID=5515 RepID=A0ABZ2WTM0_9HYPO
MASLKNIMNTDDENVDPPSETRPIALTSRPSPTQSYVTSLNRRTSPPPHNNRPDPPGSSKASSVDRSSSPKPKPNMNSRRRSNISLDSHETSYGSSQLAPSSNAPMRPFIAGTSSAEPHVKLTPITKKISKAKKGVPVHTCNQCSKDGQDGTSSHHGTTRNSPKAPPLPRKNHSRTPVLKVPDRNDPRAVVHVNNDSEMDVQWSLGPTSGSNQGYNVTPGINGPSDNYSMAPNNYVLEPTLPTTNDSFIPMYSEPRNMSTLSTMSAIVEDAPPELRWPENPALSSSASTSEFSTPRDNSRRSQFPVLTVNGPWMSTTPTYQTTSSDMSGTSMDNSTYSVTYPYDNTPPQAYPPVFGDMDLPLPGYHEENAYNTTSHIPTCAVRSISPLLAVSQSENLAAVQSLPASDGVFGLAGCSSGSTDGRGLLDTHDLKPLSLPTAISEAIPRYLDVYWEKVHPETPIIHKHTFGDVSDEETDQVEVLQCAMAALATQFIPNADDRMKGAQLHAYAWQRSKVSWEAQDYQSWARSRTRKDPKTISSTNLEMISSSDVASAPAFDAAILLAACSLFLPRRHALAHVGLVEDVANFRLNQTFISRVFPDSAIGSTYMALHHTPLYCLLSVSGKSWVFNKKVADFKIFAEHQKLFGTWRNSGTAAIATVFAARALKCFLELHPPSKQPRGSKVEHNPKRATPLVDISDYWGVYVCSLICWAFGFQEEKSNCKITMSVEEATQWLLTVADIEPLELQAQGQRDKAQGAIVLVREVLENDCLGGGNILFADAVNVLKQLERGTS